MRRGDPPNTLVGRDSELGMLRDLVQALASGTGRAALLEGEDGLGKSVLLQALTSDAAGRGCAVFSGVAHELTGAAPLTVLLESLKVTHASPDPARAEIARFLWDDTPVGLWAAGKPIAAAGDRLLALVEELCATSPVLLAVDDLHRADEASLLLWERLARATANLPLLLVGACDPNAMPRRLGKSRLYVHAEGALVRLRSLAEADVAKLVAHQLAASPGPALSRWLRRAEGNPLHVLELVDAVSRAGAVRVGADAAELDQPLTVHAPPSLSELIAGRLGGLSEPVTEMLQRHALLAMPFEDRPAVIAEAQAQGLVARSGAGWGFRHPLIRRACYEAVPKHARPALHLWAAQRLAAAGASVDAIGEQLLSAPGTDPWAVGWLTQAGAALVRRAPEMAIELMNRAIESQASEDPVRGVLRADLATAHFRGRDNAQAEAHAVRALTETHDPQLVASMRWILASVRLRTSRVEESRAVLHEALADPATPDVWRARAQGLLAIAGRQIGDRDAADCAQHALRLAESADDPIAAGVALYGLALCHLPLRPLAALGSVERARRVVGEASDRADLRLMLDAVRMDMLQSLDRMPEADAAAHAIRKFADRVGEVGSARVHVLTAEHHFWTGRWADASADLSRPLAREQPTEWLRRHHGLSALLAGHQGYGHITKELLKVAQAEPAVSPPLCGWQGPMLAAQALAAEQDNRIDDAVSALRPLLEQEYASLPERFRWLPELARLAIAAGEREVAQEAAAACEVDAARYGSGGLAALKRCRGMLAGDPSPVTEAAEHYREVGRVFERAQTLVDVAVLFARQHRVADARAAFSEAVELHTNMGARWDVRRAEARLRPYGVDGS